MRALRDLHKSVNFPEDVDELAQLVRDLQPPNVSVFDEVKQHLLEIGVENLDPWMHTGEPTAEELSTTLERLFSTTWLVADTEDSLHSLLDDTLGRMCTTAFTVRKRNKFNSYSFGRADVTVEVVVNARRVVVFRGEEKHVNSYRPGDPEHDPVEELKRKTPWDEWPDFFHDLPYIFCFYVIASELEVNLQFGCLVAASRTLQPLPGADFNLTMEEGRVGAFMFMMKLIPFMEAAARRASKATASLAWASLDRPSGASLTTGVFYGQSRIQKSWTPVGKEAAIDLRDRLHRLQGELHEVQGDEDRYFAVVCDVGLTNTRVYALFHRLQSPRLDSVNVLAAIQHVIEAVAQLHARGIIHRDIRWANVMYSRTTSRYVLIDFDEYALLDADGKAPGVARLDPTTHAPNIGERHGREVDIWSIGYLIGDQRANQHAQLRDLGEHVKTEYKALSITDVRELLEAVVAELSLAGGRPRRRSGRRLP